MKKIEKLTKYIVFKNNIKEVTSISIDDSYEYKSDQVLGAFIISGIVKEQNFGNSKCDFYETYEINHKFENTVNDLEVEILDFTYEIEENKLKINIEYQISYEEEILIEDLINNDNIEVIDFRDDEIEETKKEEPVSIPPEREFNEDDFIMYHVYTVNNNDSFESISSKYHISIDDLKNYNDIEKLNPGIKLIIPCNND